MNETEKLVRQFGEETLRKTEEIAKNFGVKVDREHLDRCFAAAWAVIVFSTSPADEIAEFCAFREGQSREEMGIVFCLISCKGGFFQLKAGNYASALESFGTARTIHGYLNKNDYRKMFANYGKAGLAKRHEPGNQLKQWVLEQHDAGTWRSANEFAHKLESEALKKAVELGAKLSAYSMKENIARWVRAHRKAKT